jgi:hypothetical protein
MSELPPIGLVVHYFFEQDMLIPFVVDLGKEVFCFGVSCH